MKINKIIKSTFIALGTSALLIACGGGDNGENTTTKNVNTTKKTNVIKSQFIDSIVSGVRYVNQDGSSGFTTSEGYFDYKSGTTKFYVGGIKIGSISKINEDKKTFIQDIVGVSRTNISHPSVLKIAQFLQTIDSDTSTEEIEIADNYKKFENITKDLSKTNILELVNSQGFSLISIDNVKNHLTKVLSQNNIIVDTTSLNILSNKNEKLISISDAIIISFDDQLLIESIQNKNFILKEENGTSIAYIISYKASNNSISIKPLKDLEFNAKYTLTIKKDLKDKASNFLEEETILSFTTSSEADYTKPTVELISKTLDIELSSVIRLKFSEDIKNYKNNIFLKDEGNISTDLESLLYDNVTNILTITPKVNLKAGSIYTLKISSSITDKAGLNLDTLNADYKEFSLSTINLLESTPLTIISSSLDNENTIIAIDSKIAITFSKELDIKTFDKNILISDDLNNLTKSLTFEVTDKTVTINHSSDFENAKAYTLSLLTGLKDKNGLALDVQKTYSFSTDSVVDKKAPLILEDNISNYKGQLKPTFTFTFNEELDQSTLENSISIISSNSNKVSLDISYANKIISITPKNNLSDSMTYTLLLKSSIKDLSSNNFDGNIWLAELQDKEYSFTTISDSNDSTAPTLITNPSLGIISKDDNIEIIFSEELKNINSESFILPLGYIFESYLNKKVTFSPTGGSDYDTSYIITLKSSISDLSGNTLGTDTSISFKTKTLVDKKKPTISSITPNNNISNVNIDSNIVINFSEAIKAESITTTNIQLFKVLKPIDGSTQDNLSSNILIQSDLSLNSNVLTINLQNDLDINSEYKLVIIKHGIKDLNSNLFNGSDTLINSDYTSKFKTVKKVSTTTCGSGYTEYLDKCYKVFTQEKSHSDALLACAGDSLISSDLFYAGGFSIPLATEFATALKLEKKSYWLNNTKTQWGRDYAYILKVSTFMGNLSSSMTDKEVNEKHKFICQKN
ncbi:MAG: Ig-like domain-containing protein [Campylobacterales bacterium]|nr:Ig-like domain-containing protein [Campylobacterales bacterium]